MTIQTIALGTAANDGTGDSLRAAGTKINGMNAELFQSTYLSQRRVTMAPAQRSATASPRRAPAGPQSSIRVIGTDWRSSRWGGSISRSPTCSPPADTQLIRSKRTSIL